MIILGLGTNLGNREANLNLAIELIGHELLYNIKRSSILTTEPLLPENAPADWNINYLNMAIAGDLKQQISPLEFLQKIKNIEAQLGRKPSARWAPREIDIDILAWGNEIIEHPDLQIPHYGLTERAFAIVPFAELAPNWIHPKTGITASEHARNLR